MEIYQGVLLGILQGITEFLPVSSSGHLVLGQHFLKMTEPMLAFDISVHLGTLAAIVIVFFKDIKKISSSIFRPLSPKSKPDIKLLLLILTGCIPTAFLGCIIKIWEDVIFSSILLVGSMLILTGIFLWQTRKQVAQDRETKISNFTFKSALFIGVCQGIAVIPGISRSGATISAGLFAGLDRKTAAKFSFLLSIPAIIGAELLQLTASMNQPIILTQATIWGTVSSFITGYIALVLLLKLVNKGKLYLFAPYCWTLGAAIIIYYLTSLF